MALRKQGGSLEERYWLNWRWFTGVLLDGIAGILFMAVVPFAPTIILLPVIAISNMSSGYLIGLFCFGEPKSWRGCLGLFFSAVAIISLAGQAVEGTGPEVIKLSFFESAVQLDFLFVNLIVFLVLVATYLSSDPSMFFMLLAAYSDGLQFLTTRTLSNAVLQGTVLTPTMWFVGGLKCLLIIVNLHCQQLALAQNLSRFAATYPLATAMLPMSLGTAFFGEHLKATFELGLAVAAAFFGLVLLSEAPKQNSKSSDLQEIVELRTFT
eukprot:CAMPEP_0197668730 /NCGR_PEP_ID=MMETSP1338-20131121/70143_1 /TAXON_ID=43686 ORGANISM="Pelagodinium beii, Strain RCC1491" /NCGR_SAMPLE_ID=MMETSP1338 /ASSEMBLY_ACC=CAM_ASM_000754 /LENGTH=266 /DNA_ID=CAMNT_0043248181 /DNA_START=120 /DNA_END=920 /DNA_ORIENTATION=-